MTSRWLIVSGDLVRTGGMDVALLGLAEHLADIGSVDVVAHRVDPSLAARPGVAFHRVARPGGRQILGAPLLALAGARRARSMLSAGDRVLCNGGNCLGDDVNWVHYVHGAYRPTSGHGVLRHLKTELAHRLFCRTEKAALERARLIVCNSERTAADVLACTNVSRDRIRVIYYGSDPGAFPLVTQDERQRARDTIVPDANGRPIALFVGALGDRRKGFDTLYAAWKRLVHDHQWAGILLVVGRGAEMHTWAARAHEDRLDGNIRFLGFRTDVPTIIAAADVMIHPARYEAYGLGVHEALCRGIPAIVPRTAGVAERFPEELAPLLVADAESVDELLERVRFWTGHQDTLGQAVRRFADTLRLRSWADMAREIVAAATLAV